MAKDPAVLLYTADFLVGAMTMTNEQAGAYIRLLCLQHQKGHLTETEMLSVCGERDEVIFAHFKQDDDGLYFNGRMDSEIEKRQKDASASRANGKKGGRPKKEEEPAIYSDNELEENLNKTQGKPKQNPQVPKSKPKQNLTENENEDENINDLENGSLLANDSSTNTRACTREDDFEKFWAVYPRKVGKGAARRAFAKIRVPVGELIAAVEEQKRSEQWRKDGGQFIPHPATWLNQERWEDEPEPEHIKKPPDEPEEDVWGKVLRQREGGVE